MARYRYWEKVAERYAKNDIYAPYRFQRAFNPQGFEEIALAATVQTIGNGPGLPPAGFVGGTNSLSEWWLYWAYTKLMGPEGQGDRDFTWEYQQSQMGGRHQPGGAVVDFIIYTPQDTIAVRLQSYYFHLAVDPDKVANDQLQRLRLEENGFKVVDIYEQHFLEDPSGEAVLDVANDSIQGIERQNPLTAGTARDV